MRVALALLASFTVSVALAQEVTLPLERYDELRARAQASPPPPPAPAAPFALEAARLDLEAGPQSVTVALQLTLTVLSEDWVQVPLPALGQLTDVRLGRLEGRLEPSPTGWTLHVRRPGRHVVDLAAVIPLRTDEDAARPFQALTFTAPRAAVVTGSLHTRAGIDEVRFAGALGRRANDASRYTFVAVPGSEVTLELLGASVGPERDRLPLAFDVRSSSLLTATRTRQELDAWLDVDVRQGTLAPVRVPVPEGYEVTSADGGAVAGWDVVDRELVLTPSGVVRGAWSVHVTLVAEPRVDVVVPVLSPLGAGRVDAAVAVRVQGPGEAALEGEHGGHLLRRDERATLPVALRNVARVVVVDDPRRPPRFTLRWNEDTEVLAVQVPRLLVDVAWGATGEAEYQVWAEVTSTGAGQLELTMPAGFAAEGAERDGVPVMLSTSAVGLAVPIRVREGTQVVHLRGRTTLAPVPAEGRIELPLPSSSAPVTRVEARLVLPGGRGYRTNATLASVTVPQAGNVAVPIALAPLLRGRAGGSTVTTSALLPAPDGTVAVAAGWSALSPRPAPFVVDVEPIKEKATWF